MGGPDICLQSLKEEKLKSSWAIKSKKGNSKRFKRSLPLGFGLGWELDGRDEAEGKMEDGRWKGRTFFT